MSKTSLMNKTRLVICEGYPDYRTFNGSYAAKRYAKHKASAQPGTHWIIFKPVSFVYNRKGLHEDT